MDIQAILFDLSGTLMDIQLDEHLPSAYQGLANYLAYHNVFVEPDELKNRYFQLRNQQRSTSSEEYPEIDVEQIWLTLLTQENSKSEKNRDKLAKETARLHRALSRTHFGQSPGVKKVLKELQSKFRLALVSDAQRCNALPEMRALNIKKYFDVKILSGDYGFRKPDTRLFKIALDQLELSPAQAIYVGNDMYRDIYGAQQAGLKTIFVHSTDGRKAYSETQPDYIARDLYQVLEGVSFLAGH